MKIKIPLPLSTSLHFCHPTEMASERCVVSLWSNHNRLTWHVNGFREWQAQPICSMRGVCQMVVKEIGNRNICCCCYHWTWSKLPTVVQLQSSQLGDHAQQNSDEQQQQQKKNREWFAKLLLDGDSPAAASVVFGAITLPLTPSTNGYEYAASMSAEASETTNSSCHI